MAEQLTKQQREAVVDRGGPLLVSAAAGSGKTKVLVDRLISYILDPVDPANIDDFLIITYTQAAATELRGKIAAKLTEHISNNPGNRHLQQQMQRLYLAKISTVHSFCSELVKEFAYQLDVSGDFRVADENECTQLQLTAMETVLNNAYADMGENPEIAELIDTQGFGRNDSQIAGIVLKVYTSARCHLNPEKWLNKCLSSADVDGLTDVSETEWGVYLIKNFRTYLSLQIDAIKKIALAADSAEHMEKPAVILHNTVTQLEMLYSQTTWEGIRAHKSIDYGRLNFSSKCTDVALIEGIKAVRDACKKGLNSFLSDFSDSSEKILADYSQTAISLKGIILLTKRFATEFQRLKQRSRVLDFSDLEHTALDLLIGKSRGGATKLAREIGCRFREVMVDEYQDSNAVQDAIFSALTVERGNCFMVGDVKQSIYQFRLADPDIFLEKYHNFVPACDAKEGEGRKVLLSKNFRSGKAVIDAVNDVFFTCMTNEVGGLDYTDDEALNFGGKNQDIHDSEIEFCAIKVESDTYGDETSYIAQRILSLLDGTHYVRDKDAIRPVTPGDIVILLRSPGSVGTYYRRALESVGIPCVTEKSTDLLQEEEITTIVSILQTINNPLQDISLVAMLTSRIFMFTADDLARIRTKNKNDSFYESLKADDTEKSKNFVKFLSQLREFARSTGIVHLIEHIFAETRMDSIYASMPDGESRVENLHAFCQLAASFAQNNAYGLNEFLSHLKALSERVYSIPGTKDSNNAVTIMSIHKSKGLEFPVVFLSGLSRDFNRKSAREQVLCDKELGVGLFCVDRDSRVRYPSIARKAIAAKILSDGLSEEMRILYVAMTRACDRLIMTYASNSLDKELNAMALRANKSDKKLLIQEANCPGEWLLLTALGRTESGALFSLLNCDHQSNVKESPWCVRVIEDISSDVRANIDDTQEEEKKLDYDLLSASLSFQYKHHDATVTASKQTATQLKGRNKDQEISQNAGVNRSYTRHWRKPDFVESSGSGAVFGKLIHKVMQYICISKCATLSGVEEEISRLVQEGYISEEEKKRVDSNKIFCFYSSAVGKKIMNAKNVLREFKFSLLDDASRVDANLAGEKILLQGVVDCALIEDDGIVVIDFKTDSVTSDTIQSATSVYSQQINIYADALSRIYELPIKEKYIYYFHLDEFVSV